MCTYFVRWVIFPKPSRRVTLCSVSGITSNLEAIYSLLDDVQFICKQDTFTCKGLEQAQT